jgi:hypothetical protein
MVKVRLSSVLHKLSSAVHIVSTGRFPTQWKQLKLLKKQHEPLNAVFSELHVRQSNELLSGQLALLPGLLLEQLQQLSMLVLSRLYTQQPGQGRPQGLPGLLTSSFVHSQPLWQDHLHVSQLEAQPLAPGFSWQTSPQLALSPLAISPPLPAPIAPKYQPIAELTYQYLCRDVIMVT